MATGMSGIFTGIDTGVLIQRLVAVNSGPLQLLDRKKATLDLKQKAVSAIESQVSFLKSVASNLADPAKLSSMSATSGSTSVLGVSASGVATEGSYSVLVNQLASAEREIHGGLAANDALVGAGAFTYTYGGASRTVLTTDTTTLAGLRDLINSDAANPGVSASILQHETGPGQIYHLVLAGKGTGSTNSIEIDDVATTLNGTNGTVDFTGATFTQTQTAQDAQLRLDGYPADGWITRSTNTITDVLAGVTLTLKSASPGTPVAVSVARDKSLMTNNLRQFVNAYNEVVGGLKTHAAYDPETKKAGILRGDSLISTLLQPVRSMLTGRLSGFDGSEDAFTLVSQIGLEIDRNGKLTLDETKLSAASDEDYDDLVALISATGSGVSSSNYVQFESAASAFEPGAYEIEITFDGETITQARYRLSGGDWASMAIFGNELTIEMSDGTPGLTINAISDGTAGVHVQTAEVRVRKGFADEIADYLKNTVLDSLSGLFTTKKQQMENSLTEVGKQIEVQETRLEKLRDRLVVQFARMEAVLASMESQSGAFNALFQSIENTNSSKSSK